MTRGLYICYSSALRSIILRSYASSVEYPCGRAAPRCLRVKLLARCCCLIVAVSAQVSTAVAGAGFWLASCYLPRLFFASSAARCSTARRPSSSLICASSPACGGWRVDNCRARRRSTTRIGDMRAELQLARYESAAYQWIGRGCYRVVHWESCAQQYHLWPPQRGSAPAHNAMSLQRERVLSTTRWPCRPPARGGLGPRERGRASAGVPLWRLFLKGRAETSE